jgi:tetratricopeptide (TPR) repeat protein
MGISSVSPFRATPSLAAVFLVSAFGLSLLVGAQQATGISSASTGLTPSAAVQAELDKLQGELNASRERGDAKSEAAQLNAIGNLYFGVSAFQQALGYFNQALPILQQLGDQAVEAKVLYHIGLAYSALAEPQKALDYFSRALPGYRAAGDHAGEAEALNDMGSVYFSVGEPQKALAAFNQVLAIDQAAGDPAGEAKALNNIASVYLEVGETHQALDSFNQALPAYRAAGNRAGEAIALNNIAMTHSILGEPQKALDFYNQALTIVRTVGDRIGEAEALMNIGAVYDDLGEKQKALDYFNQALPIYRQTGYRAGEAEALNSLGIFYRSLGEPQQALDYFNQALPMVRVLGARPREAAMLNNIGNVYSDLADRQKALEYYDQALPIYRQTGDRPGEANALNNIGNIYSALGEKQKALDCFNQALAIWRQAGDRAGEAKALNNIGIAYSDLGEMQEALDSYNQTLTIARAVGDRVGEAEALNNLGSVYEDLGQRQKALEYFSQALPIWRQTGDRPGEAKSLDNIGNAQAALGEMPGAVDSYNQALAIDRAVGNRAEEANTLSNLGTVYDSLGDKQKALDYYNQALTIDREVSGRAEEANAINNIGFLYSEIGEKRKALDAYHEALPIAISVADPLQEALIDYNLMNAEKGNRPALAIYYGKQAVNYLQRVRGNIQLLEKSLQQSFLSSKDDYYHDLADLLIEQGRLPEAQQVLDLLKLQEYTDYVRGDTASRLSPLSLTPAEQQAEDDYQKSTAQMIALGEQWATLRDIQKRTSEQEQEFHKITDQLDAAAKGLEGYYNRLYTLLGEGSQANDRLAVVQGDVSALIDAITESPHTVALYTMVGKERTSIIVITGSTAVAREYAITEKDLNQKVAAFQQALRDPRSDAKAQAQDLYKILIGPVKADLDQAQAQTLVWSLDGALRYVPIAALYDGNHYVAENYATVTFTPVSIAHLSEKPDFSNLSAVAMGISRQYDEDLPALPAVAVELDDVVNDAQAKNAQGVLPGIILLNSAFTAEAMENALRIPHTVVHIASHFVFRPGDDSQSYLLLAGKAPEVGGFHLTVADFRSDPRLALRHTDLLTLSACETGMSGIASNGREVDGLGTTAQLKGAKAVISSLWEVNDASTGALMADFYRRWAEGEGKVTKVEALREAQLDLLLGKTNVQAAASGRGVSVFENQPVGQSGGASYTHPYYWAPFVLMGNWR